MRNWRADAECIGTTSDLFFPNPFLAKDKLFHINQQAKAICMSCVVKDECSEYAISNPNLVLGGTWGQMTYKEIQKKRRARSRRK